MSWLRGEILPIEEILHRSETSCIVHFCCTPESSFFLNSGPIQNDIFVFPRQSVVIEHESKPGFLAGPNLVTLYNAGQRYQRQHVADSTGDCCDWFAVSPDVLLEMRSRYALPGVDEDRGPFAIPYVSSPGVVFRRERMILDMLRGRAALDPLEVDELVLDLLDSILQLASTRRFDHRGSSRQRRHHVEEAKMILAVTLESPPSLRAIASHVGVSVYYLCKIFRQETGFAIHEYRQQLRLRHALDEVLHSEDLLDTALRLGFNSHSHFTFAFRKEFGVTPSELRRKRALPRVLGHSA
jgi:AraC-like DNA-binding protein